MPKMRFSGFTLAELLIALAILGVIATFTIPKILSSQQNGANNAKAKEAAATLAGTYAIYKTQNGSDAGTGFSDLTPYLNYIKEDTSSLVDHVPTLTSQNCATAAVVCYLLPTGAMIWYNTATDTFGGTNSTNAIEFYVDPDGVYSNSTSGNSKSVQLYLYYTGRTTSRAYLIPGTMIESTSKNPDSNFEPDWFSW